MAALDQRYQRFLRVGLEDGGGSQGRCPRFMSVAHTVDYGKKRAVLETPHNVPVPEDGFVSQWSDCDGAINAGNLRRVWIHFTATISSS
jgi:hypothetical protein